MKQERICTCNESVRNVGQVRTFYSLFGPSLDDGRSDDTFYGLKVSE